MVFLLKQNPTTPEGTKTLPLCMGRILGKLWISLRWWLSGFRDPQALPSRTGFCNFLFVGWCGGSGAFRSVFVLWRAQDWGHSQCTGLCSTLTPLTSSNIPLQSCLPLRKNILCGSHNYLILAFFFFFFWCFKCLGLGSFQLLSSFWFLIFPPALWFCNIKYALKSH